jgi:hypothetical protein
VRLHAGRERQRYTTNSAIGFAHLRVPKCDFAIVEDGEIDGAWAEQIEIDGAGCPVALNVDRLARES